MTPGWEIEYRTVRPILARARLTGRRMTQSVIPYSTANSSMSSPARPHRTRPILAWARLPTLTGRRMMQTVIAQLCSETNSNHPIT